MKCPFCAGLNTAVKNSRNNQDNTVVRRRRLCLTCKIKFTTFEKIQLKELIVIKKSGAKKFFDKEKIYQSILTALRKRNIAEEKINEITENIVKELRNSSVNEIPSKKIGELIMNELAIVDQVAYIRFASVYKDFNNVQDFIKFIRMSEHT